MKKSIIPITVTAALLFISACILPFVPSNMRPMFGNPSVAYAQRGDTIFQTLITNGSTAGIFTSNITNIGQSQHKATIIFTNAPAKTCGGSAFVDFAFQNSQDNITWFEFGSPGTTAFVNAAGTIESTFEADGAFPFIRLAVNSFDTTNCRIAVQYTGTLQPNPAQVAVLPNYQNRGLRNIGFSFVLGAGGNGTVFTNNSTTRFAVVYGLIMCADAPTNVSFVSAGGGIMAVFPTGGGNTVWPVAGVPYKEFNRGQNVAINSSAAATVSGFITLRLEDNP